MEKGRGNVSGMTRIVVFGVVRTLLRVEKVTTQTGVLIVGFHEIRK